MSYRVTDQWPIALLLWLALVSSSGADEPEPKPTAEDLQVLEEIFALPGGHSIVGKPWVVADTGPENAPYSLQGWILKETNERVLLWEWEGKLHVLRKPGLNETRPRLPEIDGLGVLIPEIWLIDRSVVWGYQREDFLERSQAYLAEGQPKEIDLKEDDKENLFAGFNRRNQERWDLCDRAVNSARYAHCARLMGEKQHAEALLKDSQVAYERFFGRYLHEERRSYSVFVASHLASGPRFEAIYAAHDGMPRQELLELWERVAAVPYNKYREEGQDMVQHYLSLLDEDAKWDEPTPEKRAEMTVDQQVDYWMYHLRDLDLGQGTDPGMCRVVSTYSFRAKDGDPQPAIELQKLGIAAIPKLIEHMDDERPTRCKGHWRMYSPHGQYLLRYGDCCQQIFEAITKHPIYKRGSTSSYPTSDNKAAECKEKAKAWWAEYQQMNSDS